VKKTYREIDARNAFTLSIDEIEGGERPGWVERMRIVIGGDYVMLKIDAQWRISWARAQYHIQKIKLKQALKSIWRLL